MKKLIAAHRFFRRETPKYLNGNLETIRWRTREIYFPDRGTSTEWYYPLSFWQNLYYPIAYLKFMFKEITNPTPHTEEKEG